MTTHSNKSYKLRNIHSIRGTTWNVTIQKGKIYCIKIKIITVIKILEETEPLEIDRYTRGYQKVRAPMPLLFNGNRY